MSTHIPGFQSFFSFLPHFVWVKLATSSIRVKPFMPKTLKKAKLCTLNKMGNEAIDCSNNTEMFNISLNITNSCLKLFLKATL